MLRHNPKLSAEPSGSFNTPLQILSKRFDPTVHSWPIIWKHSLSDFANLKTLHPSMNPTLRNSAFMHLYGYKSKTNPLKSKTYEKVLQRSPPSYCNVYRQMCRMWHHPKKWHLRLLLAFWWQALLQILWWSRVSTIPISCSRRSCLSGHRQSICLLINLN